MSSLPVLLLVLAVLVALTVALGIASVVRVRRGAGAPHDDTLRVGSPAGDSTDEAGRRAASRALYKSGGSYGGGGLAL